jgi:hypothetical protein
MGEESNSHPKFRKKREIQSGAPGDQDGAPEVDHCPYITNEQRPFVIEITAAIGG